MKAFGHIIKDYSKFLSNVAKARQPSPIRALQPLMKIPGMISLGGGTPNPKCFPFQEMTVTLKDGTKLNIPLDEALQYSPTPGLPKFVDQLMEITATEHDIAPERVPDLKLCVTTGSQDALAKAFETFLNPGDSLIVEGPTYSGSLAFLQPYGAKLVTIPVDQDGMDTRALQKVLESWDVATQGPKPKVVYTIPTGANPSGVTMSEIRRAHLYGLACEHDMIIMEDDPYYHLSYAEKPVKTLMQFDHDNRVIRFESLSKILSAGARIGFAVGPKALIERMELHTQATSLHASGISQAVVSTLIQKWGLFGFRRHTKNVAAFYQQRRDVFCQALEDIVGRDMADWHVPSAGMFVWIDLKKAGVTDTQQLISTLADQKVLLLPGGVFFPQGHGPSSHVRASFSMASDEEITTALTRLRAALENVKKQ